MLTLGDGIALSSVCVVLATLVIKLAPSRNSPRCTVGQLLECNEWQHEMDEKVNGLRISCARLEEQMKQIMEMLTRP